MQLQEERVLLRCGKLILKISRVMAVIAAIVLAIMMILTVADVCGRNFFLKPIEGTVELIGIMLVIAGCLGLGYCQLNEGNIRITIISDRFSQRGQDIIFLFAYIIGAVVTGLICWQGGTRAWEYIFKTFGGTIVRLHLPLWPFMMLLAIGFGWACLIFLIDIYLRIRRIFSRGPN